MTRKRILLVVAAVFLGFCSVSSAIDIYLNVDNWEPVDFCTGVTPGGTWLYNLEYMPIGDPIHDIAIIGIEDQYPFGDAGQTWNYFVGGNTLLGDLYVDWYKAFDRHMGNTCLHGAEIVAYYDPDPGDPTGLTLDWIQLYSETGDSGNDFFRVDGTEDLDPAYYTEGDSPWIPGGYLGGPIGDELMFTDGPQDPHDENLAFAGEVEFYTFLAGYSEPYFDGGDLFQDIVLFDGLLWGYGGVCVVPPPEPEFPPPNIGEIPFPIIPIPEPATLCLLGLGGLLLRRRKKCVKTST